MSNSWKKIKKAGYKQKEKTRSLITQVFFVKKTKRALKKENITIVKPLMDRASHSRERSQPDREISQGLGLGLSPRGKILLRKL